MTAGVKDVRAVIDDARRELGASGSRDGAVRRRGAPVLQDPAGRAAARGRERLGDPGRRHHREPVSFSIVSPLLSRSLLVTLRAARGGRRRGAARARGRPTSAASARPASTVDRRGAGAARPGWPPVTPAGGSPRWRRRPAGRRRAGRDGIDAERRRAGGRQGGRALRPRRRPALRRHQRTDQEHPRQRRRRGAALPRPHGRGGRGPAVHRPAAGDPRHRGHRAGRPDRAADRRRRATRRSSSSGCPRGGSRWPRR